MELVPGQSLDEYLKTRSPLPLHNTPINRHICTALQYVYKFAQMPKLVKPDWNILELNSIWEAKNYAHLTSW